VGAVRVARAQQHVALERRDHAEHHGHPHPARPRGLDSLRADHTRQAAAHYVAPVHRIGVLQQTRHRAPSDPLHDQHAIRAELVAHCESYGPSGVSKHTTVLVRHMDPHVPCS